VPVKVWKFVSPSIECSGIEINNYIQVRFLHRLGLTITISKQAREGIKKLFFWQKRPEIVTVIPSDTNTIITNLKTVHIQ
jgi:hypothetical protein